MHHNSTVAKTLPYHAPLAELLDYQPIGEAPLAAPAIPAATSVVVMRILPYYPKPAAVTLRTSGTTGWGVTEHVPTPEKELTTLLGAVLEHKAPAGTQRRVEGVVTGFEWYTLVDSAVAQGAGRVSTLLTVSDASGRVLFEGERTTTGKAPAADALFRAHVRAWLADVGFVRALVQEGGGS